MLSSIMKAERMSSSRRLCQHVSCEIVERKRTPAVYSMQTLSSAYSELVARGSKKSEKKTN